jgi:hypothetical protein
MGRELTTARIFAERTARANWNSTFRSMDFWAKAEKRNIPQGMIDLAKEARYFIRKYEAFFEPVEQVLDPEEKDEFTRATILHSALGTALEEWDTIRHALEQRENDRYDSILAELDTLSVECLSPLFGRERFKNGGVYTYIHKLFDIRRFAFSSTPLIGAPYDALNAPEAWLAIPHETGHYVFWNGTNTFESFSRFYFELQKYVLQVLEIAIQKRVTGNLFRRKGLAFQTWMNWIDEIFADVFGTLVAGPAYAWSMQSNLRAQFSLRDLYHSHEEPEHPDPFIRPFIHISALREMANVSEGDLKYQLVEEADSLKESWEKGWFDTDVDGQIKKLPTPNNIGSMRDILDNEVPWIVKTVLNTSLGENLPKPLIEYFKEGVLYNQDFHGKCVTTAQQIANGEKVQVSSPLEKSVAAQLAIVQGAEPVYVHQVLGYGGKEDEPEANEELDARFNEFIANVTQGKTPKEQLDGWRRVLGYSLMDQAFHWHTHPHYHG